MTTSMKAAVVVASNRAAAGVYADETGPLIASWLTAEGFECGDPVVVPDGRPVGQAISAAVEAGARVVLTTGGTGLTPTDLTPEATRPLLDREVPGIADATTAWPTRSRPRCSRAVSPVSSVRAWWSTCPARVAA